MSPETALLADAVAASWDIADNLVLSIGDLAPLTPLDAAAVAALDRRQQKDVLSFLKTFEQLQDIAANRLVRAILVETGADVTGWSARDAFERMEALGALEDARRFLQFAQLRNRLVQEYPMTPEKRATRINDAFAAAEDLLAETRRLTAYAEGLKR